MRFSLLFGLLALSAQLAAAQTSARPATVKTKTKTAGLPSAKSKSAGAAASPSVAEADEAPADDRVAARANALTDNMREALALTSPQTEKVRAINTRSVRNVEQARLRYRTDPRKLQAYIEDVGSSRLSALKDVLTPAQFAKYQRKREEKMGIPSTPAATGNAVPGLPGSATE